MTEFEARKIGSRQSLISIGVGLLIAQLIMTSFSSSEGVLKGFLWFTSFGYILNLFIGIAIMLISGHFYGQIAGEAILIRKRNHILTGFLCGMAILMTTAFLSSLTGFFQEGINNDHPFRDYIFTPVFTIFIFGIIPVFLVGIWFGGQIQKHES